MISKTGPRIENRFVFLSQINPVAHVFPSGPLRLSSGELFDSKHHPVLAHNGAMESVAPEPLFQAHGSFVVVACFEKRGLPCKRASTLAKPVRSYDATLEVPVLLIDKILAAVDRCKPVLA